MTEIDLRRWFLTPFCLFILCAAPSQKMRARVTRDSTICAKNSTFGYFDGTNPIPRLWLPAKQFFFCKCSNLSSSLPLINSYFPLVLYDFNPVVFDNLHFWLLFCNYHATHICIFHRAGDTKKLHRLVIWNRLCQETMSYSLFFIPSKFRVIFLA